MSKYPNPLQSVLRAQSNCVIGLGMQRIVSPSSLPPAPDGRRSRVRTVWQVDDGEIAPRLITAYPLEQV